MSPSNAPVAPASAVTAETGAARSSHPIPASGGMSGFNGTRRVPVPVNEPVRGYAPGTPERASIKARLDAMAGERIEIPLVIGGEHITTGDLHQSVMPHDHQHVLADWHAASPEHVQRAIVAAREARREWGNWAWEDRAAVFLRAAEMLTTTWRDTVNSATMLGQSKTVHQAEIDAACELIDFWRFNAHFAQELYGEQPYSDHTMWNQMDYRPLEGFVYAVTPFNFTSIAGNLPTAPALMGCTVLWKPSQTSMLSSWYLMRLLEEAGLPPGVINFIPSSDPAAVSEVALGHEEFAGLHYTGSTAVFNSMWATIGSNVGKYQGYPRIVGETGGKDFIVAHSSADVETLAVAIVRGGFEFQGQKCSAASRVYVPRSIWSEVRDRVAAMIGEIRMGDPRDFRNFMGAVIDERAFRRHDEALGHARANAKIVAGGEAKGEQGWFVQPTLIETADPGYRLLAEELFGPIVTAHVYDDDRWEETLRIVDATSPYGLTGAVFARDRRAVKQALFALRHSAGNMYVNDKPTGAVVGQQPFGGSRGSGTNDKAGSKLNLVRWVSARNVKETFVASREHGYPFMGEE